MRLLEASGEVDKKARRFEAEGREGRIDAE
jgi:hypothetical protein